MEESLVSRNANEQKQKGINGDDKTSSCTYGVDRIDNHYACALCISRPKTVVSTPDCLLSPETIEGSRSGP
jgi:hypothetical protein